MNDSTRPHLVQGGHHHETVAPQELSRDAVRGGVVGEPGEQVLDWQPTVINNLTYSQIIIIT